MQHIAGSRGSQANSFTTVFQVDDGIARVYGSYSFAETESIHRLGWLNGEGSKILYRKLTDDCQTKANSMNST